MKEFLKLSGLICITMLLLTGCGVSSIQNIETPLTNKTNKLKEIEKSILYAATELRWDIIKVNDNLLQAKYIVGNNKHIAYINIPFTINEYKIEYLKSTNLKYNKEDKTIHGAYGKWTKLLNESIDNAIKNKLMYFGEVKTEYLVKSFSNEDGKQYKVYYHQVDKYNYNKQGVSILRAKDGFGFMRINKTKLINEFKMGFVNQRKNFVDYLVTNEGKYEIVLLAPMHINSKNPRVNTIIIELKAGHEYLFDYNFTKKNLTYWIQDLTENKKVSYKANTSVRDWAFFFSESKKK